MLGVKSDQGTVHELSCANNDITERCIRGTEFRASGTVWIGITTHF